MKKMAKVMVLVLALCLVVPSICSAAVVTMAAATVSRTGPNASGTVYIQLTDTHVPPAFPGSRWYAFPAAQANQMLATALTAMSLTKTVWVSLAGGAEYSSVTYMYLNP